MIHPGDEMTFVDAALAPTRKTGQIKPVASASLCLTAGTNTIEGGGGNPVHLKRGLTWETCASSAATRQQWKLKS